MILYPQNGDVVKGVSKNLQVVYKAKKPDGADNFLVGKIVGTPFDKFLNSWYNNGAMNNLGLFIVNLSRRTLVRRDSYSLRASESAKAFRPEGYFFTTSTRRMP